MAINKVIYGADTLVDLTEDTVTAEDVLNSKSFHTPDGVQRTGTASYPVTDVQVNGTSVMDGTVAKVVQPTAEVKTASDTFTTVNGGLLEECVIDLVPVQDLHGYDSPWVGGAGKNKLDNKRTMPYISWGVTFTQNADGSIEANGKATGGNAAITLWSRNADNQHLPSGNYTLSGCPAGGSNSTYYMQMQATRNGDLYSFGNDMGDGITGAVLDTDAMQVTCLIVNGYTADHVKFYPQLEVGSTATSYEPYSNICPINGHTEVDLYNVGKNRLPFHIDNVKSNNLGGTWSGNIYTYKNVDWIFDVDANGYIQKVTANGLASAESNITVLINDYIKAGTLFKYNGVPTGGSSSTYQAFIRSGGYDRGSGNAITPTQANIDNDYYWYRIAIANGYNAQNVVFYPMIYVGGDAAYEPYLGHLYQVQIGSTVYGGYVDLVSGVMTVTHGCKDMGSLTWSAPSATYKYFQTTISDMVNTYTTVTSNGHFMCSNYSYAQILGNSNNEGMCLSVNYLRVRDNNYATAVEFTTAMSGVQFVYELATPFTIQLTPQQIETLVGQNNLSTPLDGQSIDSVKYREIFAYSDIFNNDTPSDATTYTSSKIQTSLDTKVDKVDGKGLSSNDYTDEDKIKLEGIESGAEVNVQSDWNQTDNTADDYIKNKPSSEVKSATDTFTTVNGGLLEECVIDLAPVQDLHGYDSPWVGGAGKNKLEVTGSSTTVSGVTFTINADGTILVNGTSTAEIQYNVISNWSAFPSGNYILNGCPSGVANIALYVNPDRTQAYNDIGSGVSFSVTSEIIVRIYIKNGVTANNFLFKPMIRLATESDPTFEPYSNICPITGHTEVDLYNVGKNLFYLYLKNKKIDTSGNIANSDILDLYKAYVKGGESYTVSFDHNITSTGNINLYYAFYDESDNRLSYSYISYSTPLSERLIRTITADQGAKYILFSCRKTAENYQIEEGSTATPYEPYLGHLYQVQIGSTVYGGYVDLVSGVGEITDVSVDLGSLSDTYYDSTKKRFVCPLSGVKTTGASDITTAISSVYKAVSFGNLYNNLDLDGVFAVSTQGSLSIRNLAYTDKNAFLTAMSGQTIVYPLATPFTIQLTPQQIEALPNVNNLSTPLNGQSIDSVKYREVFAFDDVEKVVSLRVPISMLGTDESGRTTASQAYASGDYFYKDGYMCKALTSISAGATLTLNTNYSQGTLADILKAIENA